MAEAIFCKYNLAAQGEGHAFKIAMCTEVFIVLLKGSCFIREELELTSHFWNDSFSFMK